MPPASLLSGKVMIEGKKHNQGKDPSSAAKQNPALENLFNAGSQYDGQLMHSRDRVTYTFLTQTDVVSLHFDRVRKTIYYKGHNVQNMVLTNEHKKHLEDFALAIENQAKPFLKAYKQTLKSFVK